MADSQQAPRVGSGVKRDLAPPRREELPDSQTHVSAGGKPSSNGGHPDDRSGSD
jgi:hypothetical protein